MFDTFFDVMYADQKIARGILKRMGVGSVTNISSTTSPDGYSFTLDGFNISIHRKDRGPLSVGYYYWLEVDGVKMECKDNTMKDIWNLSYNILNNDEIEKERMTRKDALIHFGNM